MKLARFLKSNKQSYGILIKEDQIVDLQILSKNLQQSLPYNIEELIQSTDVSFQILHSIVQNTPKKEIEKATTKLKDAELLAPIASPPKIICLGLNYHDHIEERKESVPTNPVIFMKPRTAVIGPEQAIIKPSFVKELDYEGELAIVMGKRGKNINLESAKNHIFGYTCFNDVSARDIQFKDKQWTRGKSFDTFAPMGPCITTADQLDDPNRLSIRTRVNRELRQNGSTNSMVFSVYQIVSELSQIMTLEPCDIIATGTPAGVGFAMKPKPKFLEPGDTVEVEIESIGILRNTVTG